MGGARGVTTTPTTPATTPATPQLVNRGAGMSTLPVPPTTPATTPATIPSKPQLINRGAGMSTLPVPPTGPIGFPSTSNKGGGTAAIPSPTFASDPIVAQPLPTPIQSNKGGGITSPLTPTPTSPYTGLASIPLSPYGSTGYTSPGPQIDVTELSKTSFDPELTARDTLRRLDAIDKRFAEQDAAAANAPTAEEIQAEQDRIFAESRRRFLAAQADGN